MQGAKHPLTIEAQLDEVERCEDPAYFIDTFVQIDDATSGGWIPFDLWPAQREVIRQIHEKDQVCVLKARQVGLSWIVLGYILWRMLFRFECTALIFSYRLDEAINLLDDRLKEMHRRLPGWMQSRVVSGKDSKSIWQLSNGSEARAFAPTAGDSYTASIVLMDEADLVPDLNRLMRSVKPTIDAGGKLIQISRADKGKPESEFKKTYRSGRAGKSKWHSVFLPWHARPSRSQEWYEEQKTEVLERTGSLDDLYEQYPATDEEALAPRSQDKRIPWAWLRQCHEEAVPLDDPGATAPAIAGLCVFAIPVPGRTYSIGADPAEGNPTSDDSALTVLDAESKEEVACLAGKFEPSVFASHIAGVSEWYNSAAVLPERNNHGHAVILWLSDNSDVQIVEGTDGKAGWLSNSKGKSLMYERTASACKDKETTIRSKETLRQLASIEGASLRAPKGQMDDRADSFALALKATESNRPLIMV